MKTIRAFFERHPLLREREQATWPDRDLESTMSPLGLFTQRLPPHTPPITLRAGTRERWSDHAHLISS
jgi:hypothetical protein